MIHGNWPGILLFGILALALLSFVLAIVPVPDSWMTTTYTVGLAGSVPDVLATGASDQNLLTYLWNSFWIALDFHWPTFGVHLW